MAFSEDLDLFFDAGEFAETVTYEGAEILAVIDAHEDRLEGFPGVPILDAKLLVKASDVARPKRGDTVTLPDGRTYKVTASPKQESGVWSIWLHRVEVQVG